MAKKVVKEVTEWWFDNFDEDTDPFEVVRDIALKSATTKGNRNGHNDKSFIGPERLQVLWRDREDVKSRVQRYLNARNKADSIDKIMDGFEHDMRYTVYRNNKSNVSPKMVDRYKNVGVKRAPGNNGRIRAGQLCAILAAMDAWSVGGKLTEMLITHNHAGFTKKALIDAGSFLLDTQKTFKVTSKSKRVVNLNNQHTRTSMIIVNGKKIIDKIDTLD
jgi:hypothetical protein